MEVWTGGAGNGGIRAEGWDKPVLTLGTFDGVHLGHQAILSRVRGWADEIGGQAVLLTFDPHPRSVVQGTPPPLLTPLELKLRLLGDCGLDHVVVLPFTPELSRVPVRTFVEETILGKIGAHRLVLGPDAHFGRNREGNAAFLERNALRYELEVVTVPFLRAGAATVSSTNIRSAVLEGDLCRAREMLGRPYALLGRVVQGEGRGRQLGFPTANLQTGQIMPPNGVYRAETLHDGAAYASLANIGVAPTFRRDAAPTPEVHLLDYRGDLYGAELEVRLFELLRAERRFADRAALVDQINHDVRLARRLAGSA